jgi:hypothetical protein
MATVVIATIVISAVIVSTVVVKRIGWRCYRVVVAPIRFRCVACRQRFLPAIRRLGTVRRTLALRPSSTPAATSALLTRFRGLLIEISGRGHGFVHRFLVDVRVLSPRSMFVVRSSVVALAALAS